MSSVNRFSAIEVPFQWLDVDDKCFNFGEYTAEGGWSAGDTNRWIKNLKKKPTASQNELYYKNQAYGYWSNLIRPLLPFDKLTGVTWVPMPGSKPFGHPEFDPRMLRVLQHYALNDATVDIRDLLVQTVERPAQHLGHGRLTPGVIASTLAINPNERDRSPLRPMVFLFDDVITMGASFKAAKSLILQCPGVRDVRGVFLARTIWDDS